MTPRQVSIDEALAILTGAEIEVMGRMPWSSNKTYLAQLHCGEIEALAIYKPRRGERPLWDFPEGSLCDRELAAFLVSEALGWRIAPPTIVRDGPMGEGMLQLYIDHDPDEHYLTLGDAFPDRFRQFAAFDLVINNADRKSGHCLRAQDDHIWGIDHGVSFHESFKVRTVIWDFAGERLSHEIADDLGRLSEALDAELGSRLEELLSGPEVEVTRRRAQRLAAARVFPSPRSDYPYPWPAV